MNTVKIVILTVMIFIIIGLIIYLKNLVNSTSSTNKTTSPPSVSTTSPPSVSTTSPPSVSTTSPPSVSTTSPPSVSSSTVLNPGDVIKIAYGDANKPVFVAPGGHTNNIGTLPFTVGAGSKLFNFKYTPMSNFPAGVTSVRSRITFSGPKSYEIYKEFSSPINILTISHIADNSELPAGTYRLNIYIDYGESFSVEGTVAIAAPAAKRKIFNIYDNTRLFKGAMLNEAMNTTITIPVISNTDKVSLLFDGTVSIGCQGAADPYSIKFTLYNDNNVYKKSFEKLSANWGDTSNHNILPFTVIFTDVKPGAYKFVIGSGSSWPSSCNTDINDYVSAYYEIITPSSSSLVSRSISNVWDNQTLNVGSMLNDGIKVTNISVPVIAKLVFNGYITIACTDTAAYTIEFRLKNDSYNSITSRSYANYSRNKHVISPFTAVFYDVPPGTYNLVIGSSKDWPVSVCNTSPNDYLSMFYEIIPTPVSTSPLLLRTRNIEKIWENAGLPDGSAITRVDGISTSIINIPSSISSASIIINGCISIRCSMDGIAYTIKFRLQKTDGGYDKSFKRTYADWIGKGHNISPFMIMFPDAPPGNYKFNISADDESVTASNWKGCATDGADFLTAFYEIVPN